MRTRLMRCDRVRHGGRAGVVAIFVAIVCALQLGGCATVTEATSAVARKAKTTVGSLRRKSDDTTRPASGEFELTGMLEVLKSACDGDDCPPRYRLHNEDFSVRTALGGELHDVHSGLLVTVHGEWNSLASPLEGDAWRRRDARVEVARYDVLSGVRYDRFLERQSSGYTKKVYGCESMWDRRFGWQIVNREPYLIVQMIDPRQNQTGVGFVELWYHGKSGQFLRESKSNARINPCK